MILGWSSISMCNYFLRGSACKMAKRCKLKRIETPCSYRERISYSYVRLFADPKRRERSRSPRDRSRNKRNRSMERDRSRSHVNGAPAADGKKEGRDRRRRRSSSSPRSPLKQRTNKDVNKRLVIATTIILLQILNEQKGCKLAVTADNCKQLAEAFNDVTNPCASRRTFYYICQCKRTQAACCSWPEHEFWECCRVCCPLIGEILAHMLKS